MGCSGCVHWRAIEYRRPGGGDIGHGPHRDPYMGQCRRYAPRPTRQVDDLETVFWPLTAQDDWCGEWEQEADPDPVHLGPEPKEFSPQEKIGGGTPGLGRPVPSPTSFEELARRSSR